MYQTAVRVAVGIVECQIAMGGSYGVLGARLLALLQMLKQGVEFAISSNRQETAKSQRQGK